MTKKGKLIVLSAPSGAGKTTIARAILEKFDNLRFSISATTRNPRPNEKQAHDYFFLTKEDFTRRVANNEFVEWEEVYGQYYGTLWSHINEMLDSGKNIILDIDVKGGLNIQKKFGHDVLTIFIMPPDLNTLKERLKSRKTESDDLIKLRLERVPMEMEVGKEFQHVVVNDDLQKAIAEVLQLITDFIKN